MALKKISESPTIADTILFELQTVDADGCPVTPYKVDRVTIYFVEREFTDTNYSEYTTETIPLDLQEELKEAREAYCDSPNDVTLAALQAVQEKINAAKLSGKFYYKEARPVATFGYRDAAVAESQRVDNEPVSDDFPAWLNPSMVPVEDQAEVEINNILSQAEDEDEVVITGLFNLEWNPLGRREGDYFICWTWAPEVAGDMLSAHQMFTILGNTQITTSIPTHVTKPNKYETLLERYLPAMFRGRISDDDLTPQVLDGFNKAVAKGFTFLEDQANQTIDLLDANATHESLLLLLGNLFNLRLKSNDPTLWRRQIKNAMTNYKKKGTMRGLESALSDAGMSLLQLTKLWQVVSDYTWQEHFTVEDEDVLTFELEKEAILPIDEDNFELYYRASDADEWEQITSDYVTLTTDDGITTLAWVGDELSIDPIILEEGDSIRIVYQIEEVPSPSEQTLETYIRTLPLADQRDERDQQYPPKNWNVRLIEEGDPLFDSIIPNRHPFYDPLVWGQIRTEFPYSENVYNMEEYNGSTRDSTNPCDIGKEFLDPCSDCQGSKFNIDVEIEELSNDRIVEAQNIIEEFMPIHAVPHSINFSGAVNEFFRPPVETINAYIHFLIEEVMMAGEAQHIFNRAMPPTVALAVAKRNMLTDMVLAAGPSSGTASNAKIVLVSPGSANTNEVLSDDLVGEHRTFDRLNLNRESVSGAVADNTNWLEVIGPSSNAGDYSVTNPSGNIVEISAGTITEPLDKSQFAFRLSNRVIDLDGVSITEDHYYTFIETGVDFTDTQIFTQWDDDQGYTGTVWTLDVSGFGTYNIQQVLPDGSLVLIDDGSLPSASNNGLTWELFDGDANSVLSGTAGRLTVRNRGLVEYTADSFNAPLSDVQTVLRIGDYILHSGDQYRLMSFVEGEETKFYIEDYTGGDVAGVDIVAYRRLIDNGIGHFSYQGMKLTTLVDHEAGLPVQNGVNEVATQTEADEFKENYLILLQGGSPDTEDETLTYYSMDEIDGTEITLNGPYTEFTTGGTAVTYIIYRFEKQPITIPERNEPHVPGHVFDYDDDPPLGLGGHVDRDGSEVISVQVDQGVSMALYASVLNAANAGDESVMDTIQTQESINFKIEYLDGTEEKGEI